MSAATSSDGTAIGCTRTGSGPALVLVDAATCHRAAGPMPALADALASRFTVYTYDRRGRGESGDTPPYAITREVEDLAAVIALAGGSAFVHGFSSGAVLALHAAAQGLPIRALSLLEPPYDESPAVDEELAAALTGLIGQGRRGDAVEHFQAAIGVPAELVAGMRRSPGWPALEALAHTLAYDLLITGTPVDLGAVRVPVLVVDSAGTDARLRAWADGVAARLPAAARRTLPGEWHGVAPEVLAPVLAEHFGQAE
ncbi:alpha/beta hydrolase [Actinosynnema sp. NPDC047251]|uniref:Alpha/beta hydrolase fold-1 domain-containing protein n=1 Tax=Saccharothrix espanaensis (strain ATCC 51144 / DSM 44229 / JCM 9112 / NBRC 15066 / NRRL 15764) TaxID=1179773 RepID=K0K4X8_SACES|nr:alpha/beta hydrolase [Saccharothrix espanaensis]CCH33356.1 alpha/beta hydrolase fold-1 domain-containing protein [Saccharothrix espanaensis DSM 44229]